MFKLIIFLYMQNCKCNEPCLYIRNMTQNKIKGDSYIEYFDIYKCNRLPGENSRKPPCTYFSSTFVKRIKLELSEKKNSNSLSVKYNSKNNFIDINDKINKLFDHYYINSTNYFGKLNYYLQQLGYAPHDPIKESLNELKIRLKKKPLDKTRIFINKDSYFSRCVGELYNDNEIEMYERIKRRENPLEWTNDEYIKTIINREINNRSKKLKNSLIKPSKKIKYTNNYLFVTDYIDNKNEEDNSEDDNDDNESVENIKDNEFDIEEITDDDNDYKNDDYNDFSD